MMEGNNKLFRMKNKVRVSCSMLNPILSRNSIAKQVKAIRKSLVEISNDMGQFGFVRCSLEEPVFGMRERQDPGSFVDPKYVFGRDEDKKTILEILFNESSNVVSDAPAVISIVGIGGMGKTTLAQLIYNDEEVDRGFEKKWFACISDTSDENEVLGKIFQVVCDQQTYSGLTSGQLQTKIRESMKGKKFLLVLDDVWDEDHARWQHRMSLLGGGAKGSKIIVTTRSSSVAIAVDAFKTHNLQGLSEDDSWDLFKRVAFTPERENDPRWTILGREIVKKCARVPLAIRSIGSLLYTKNTVQEWESIRDQELSMLKEQSDPESILSVLQLSYDHLPSNLKHCFAYCSMFPKDFEFDVQKLVYLWIAQGYIKPNEGESVEVAGRSYFMSLLRRSFFQEAEKNWFDEISSCKMHDLVHDLAQNVAGEEVVMLKASCSGSYNSARHVGVDRGTVDAGEILQQKKLNMRILRSLMLVNKGSCVSRDLGQQLRSGKYLRVLNLSRVRIEDVPSFIGELKLLRYLDLSWNKFKRLPDSISYLLNLFALDLSCCKELEALPDEFRKLINLVYLDILGCPRLKHMPRGFGELGSLRYLSNFKVGHNKATTRSSEEREGVGIERSSTGLDALSRLGQLRGGLRIQFENGIEDWDGDECSWQLPVSLQDLTMDKYPDNRIPQWANNNNNDPAFLQPPNLVYIELLDCRKVKYLPRFRDLPYLKRLNISGMVELEYIEEEDEEEIINERATGLGNDANSLFFPCLEALALINCSKLKGWSRRDDRETKSTTPNVAISMQQQQHLSFPVLSEIEIEECTKPQSFPISASGLQTIQVRYCNQLKTLSFVHPHLSFPVLSRIWIASCPELKSMTSSTLGSKTIDLCYCNQLKTLRFAHPEVVEELMIYKCPELGLGSVDWDSLPNLRRLELGPHPLPEKLPECLERRRLQIRSTPLG